MTETEQASATSPDTDDARELEASGTRTYRRFPVMEIFGPTYQGEGDQIGEKTMFVRFGGCDFRCTMCDSMHAVDPRSVHDNAQRMRTEQIIDALDKARMGSSWCNWVSLSGGNPAIHDLSELVRRLQYPEDIDGILGQNSNPDPWKVHVETQGSYWHESGWLARTDSICISPKGPGMGETFNQDDFNKFLHNLQHHPRVSIKVVIFGEEDLEFAGRINHLVYNFRHVYNRAFRPGLYLSLGNPWPPGKAKYTEEGQKYFLEELLERYTYLAEKALQWPMLHDWRLTPQMHVLFWGNKKGK